MDEKRSHTSTPRKQQRRIKTTRKITEVKSNAEGLVTCRQKRWTRIVGKGRRSNEVVSQSVRVS